MTRKGLIVHRIAWLLVRLIATVYFRYRMHGAHHLPKDGPVLVIANHISLLDPPLVGIGFRQRALTYMAKRELWDLPLLKQFLDAIMAIPVARQAGEDRRTFMAAVRRLKAGEAVLIFPEGTRSRSGELQEFQAGAAALACSVPGVRILPVRLHGTYAAMPPGKSMPRPRKIRVVVGESFAVDEIAGLPAEKKSLYRALSDVMFKRISSL